MSQEKRFEDGQARRPVHVEQRVADWFELHVAGVRQQGQGCSHLRVCQHTSGCRIGLEQEDRADPLAYP